MGVVAGGNIGEPPIDTSNAFQVSLQVKGRLRSAEEFGEIIIKTGAKGEPVRLGDVARVELGARLMETLGRQDGSPAAVIGTTIDRDQPVAVLEVVDTGPGLAAADAKRRDFTINAMLPSWAPL